MKVWNSRSVSLVWKKDVKKNFWNILSKLVHSFFLSQICIAAGMWSFCFEHYTSEHFTHFCCFIVLIFGLLWKEPNLSRSKSTSLFFPTSSLVKKKLHSCTCGSKGKLKWNVDSSPGCSQSNSDLRPKNSYDGKHTFIAALIHILLHTPSRTHAPSLRWTDGTLKICTVFVFMWAFFPICLPERETKHSSMSLPCSDAPVTEIWQTHAGYPRIREPLAV